MLLSTELVKYATILERMYHMDTITTRLCGCECEVWALASKSFPPHLVPKNTDGYLCYIGISPEKIKTSYGYVHFLEFGHEPLTSHECDDEMGLLEHMFNIYTDKISNELYNSEEDIVHLYPRIIDSNSIDYWSEIAEQYWGVNTRTDLENFIKDNELDGYVNWEKLHTYLPNVYYPSERVYSDSESESDADSETEEDSDSKSSSEQHRKRRKLVIDETESENDEA